ncbi:hypothetical protein Tco_1205853 [Tanacetum coccineum]
MQQPLPNNNYNPPPSFNQNYVQQTMINLDNISDPTIAMNMALALMAKAFKLSTPTNNNKRISSNPRNRQIAQPGMNMGQDRHIQNVRGNGGNQFGQNQNGTGNVVPARAEGTGYGYNDNQIRCYNCRGLGHYARNYTEEAKIQLQAEEYDLMPVAADIDEIEEVNANCILMANLTKLQSMTRMAQLSVEQSGGIVEQHFATVEEIHAYYQSLYKNLAVEVKKVNMVYRNMKATNCRIDTRLARCSAKQTTTLNEEITNLNTQLSNEKSTISFLQEERKKLKSYFKKREDELLDKQILLENKIKGLENIRNRLGHNLFSVGQFCDSDLEVAFKRNTCFIRNLEGVYLLKGNQTSNLYTINLHDMAFASRIFLMARATSTKSRLWHQRLSYLNFDTINDLAKNDLDVDEFSFHQHVQQQDNQAPLQSNTVADNLKTDGDMCIDALSVSTMEPSNVKEAMTDSGWIDSMQEELL